MRGRIRKNSDYGEGLTIAVELLDGPLDMNEIRSGFRSLSRNLGFFDYTGNDSEFSGTRLNEHISEMVVSLISSDIIIENKGKYSLTDNGRTVAEKAYEELIMAGNYIRKALSPETATAAGFIVHLLIAAVKLPAALLSGSIGLFSDSMDTIADALTSLLVFIGIKLNRKKAAGIILAVVMTLSGGYAMYNAISRIFNPVSVSPGPFAVAAALASAVVYLLLGFYQRYTGTKTKTPALVIQSIDSRNHVIAALSVAAGILAFAFDFIWIDIAVGLAVSAIICKSAAEVLVSIIRSDTDEALAGSNSSLYMKWFDREMKTWILDLIFTEDFKSIEVLKDFLSVELDASDTKSANVYQGILNPGIYESACKKVGELIEDGLILADSTGVRLDYDGLETHRESTGEAREKRRKRGMIKKRSLLSIGYFIEYAIAFSAVRLLSSLGNPIYLLDGFPGVFKVWKSGFSLPEIILFAVCAVSYIIGRTRLAGASGKNRRNLGVKLISDGLYSKVRHPMYSAMLIMQLSVLTALSLRWTAIAGLAWIPFMFLNAVIEERQLLKIFGEEYREYMARVGRRMFTYPSLLLLIVLAAANITGIIMSFISM